MSVNNFPAYRAKHYSDSTEDIIYGELNYGEDNLLVCALYAQQDKPDSVVASISTQFGCSVRCNFCNVPQFKANAYPQHAIDQVRFLIEEAQKSGVPDEGIQSLKITMVKAGDPANNPHMDPMVGSLIEEFRDELPVPTIKVSTSFPRNNRAMHNMSDLIRTANSYAQEGGIIYPQVSLHSTEDHIRQKTTRMPLLSQDGIQSFGNAWYKNVGVLNGIKPALAFTLSDDSARHCSASDIVSTLPPERFAVLVRGQLVKGKDLLSEESFDDLRADFESHGYLFVDGKATVLEILHDTEVGVWETLEKHSDTETYSQSANSIHTLSL